MVGKLGGTEKQSSEGKGNNLGKKIGQDTSNSVGSKSLFLFSHYSILNLLCS